AAPRIRHCRLIRGAVSALPDFPKEITQRMITQMPVSNRWLSIAGVRSLPFLVMMHLHGSNF
ncbi:MAG: hypothetical protein QMB61_10975, partial [Clostridiaceae bacterium]